MSKQSQLSLAVFIDALGWQVFQQYGLLNDVLAVRKPLDTIIGYSCACDPTIITGQLPNVHGHFSFFSYDPPKSPFSGLKCMEWAPKALTSRARVRRQISRLVKWWHGYNGYFEIYNVPFRYLPLMDYSEKQDIYQHHGLINNTPTIFDSARELDVPFELSDWRKSETENIASMTQRIEAADINFGYLYLAGLDGIMHADGTQSDRVRDKLKFYDRQLRQLLDIADRNYDEIRLHIFSDHGMTNTHTDFNLVSIIESLPLKYGTDYAAVYDSTMARFWFMNPEAEGMIRGALSELEQGRILSTDDLTASGVWFPDGRYGELFYMMNPGVVITPSFMNARHVPGMHGYDPTDKDSVAFYGSTVSNGPQPQRLDDLFSVMQFDLQQGVGSSNFDSQGVATSVTS